MGADHKGPLAAFVVIAVVAAIVLVTSVRSQAVTVLSSVGHHLDRAVSSGVGLVERTVSTTPAPPRTTAGPASLRPLPAHGGHAVRSHGPRGRQPPAPSGGPASETTGPVGPVDDQTTGPGTHPHHGPAAYHGQGRHLGWSRSGPHGRGHAHGHSQGHRQGHGQGHGQGPTHAWPNQGQDRPTRS